MPDKCCIIEAGYLFEHIRLLNGLLKDAPNRSAEQVETWQNDRKLIVHLFLRDIKKHTNHVERLEVWR